ncbi:MAG: hypothetical protein HY696_05515 [Deltaproteobacteria bacterium]|nr:hypothetical protein [Deltaproteobacteria bacterium]
MVTLDYLRNFFPPPPILHMTGEQRSQVVLMRMSGRWQTILIATVLVASARGGQAGVPQVIHPRTGAAIAWATPSSIPAIFDAGPLGLLDAATAREFVEALMGVWEEVSDASVGFVSQGQLAQDITADNLADVLDGTVCADNAPAGNASMRRGESPIIFDHDGRIIELLAGKGASRRIVGKSGIRCYRGTLDNPQAATQAFLILNGLFIDGQDDPPDLDINLYAGIILHELGHFIGLHHSMVNETIYQDVLLGKRNAADSRFVPVMYPLVLPSSEAATVLKPDDLAAVTALYPTAAASGRVGQVRGVVTDGFGNGLRGANVVARRQDDPLCHAVSAIAGRSCTPLRDMSGAVSVLGESCVGDDAAQGGYRVEGLLPGDYTIEVSEIVAAGGARDNMFPRSEPLLLPGPAEYFNVDDQALEDPDVRSIISVAAGAEVDAIDVVVGGNDSRRKSLPVADYEIADDVTAGACPLDPVDYGEWLHLVNGSDANIGGAPATVTGGTDGATLASTRGCSFVPDVPQTTGNARGWWLVGAALCGWGLWRKRRPVATLLAIGVLSAPAVGHSSTYLPLSLDDLVSQAGDIVYGECVRRQQVPGRHGFSVTEVTYRVVRRIKGAPAHTVGFSPARLTFRLAAAEDGAAFQPGRTDVLFLYPVSAWGYTSVVGGVQGQWRVTRDARGRATVSTPARNRVPLPTLLAELRHRVQRHAP